ncbi:uncharacterized protein LOC131927888 [Physella acuta]|uniref:uncharacterized protein LOC131927888 n=1 Tax=Physella acuta TaxID=109671 RepID=UPI0027DE3725|nr:uncharacterized protein LOC131927888 [Physella acuta]
MQFFHVMDNIIYVCFLLSSVFCISESSFCSPDMEYHDHTRTCLKLFERKENYVQAKSFCQRNVSGGKDNSKKGYLVRIYDSVTDNFVKDYLRRNGVNTALIGLNDRAIQGVFRWDEIQEEVTYFGWAKPFTQNPGLRSVVIESNGWREHSGQQERFICQVEAVLPEAKMTCPPAQIGDLDHKIACVVNLRDPSILKSTSLTKDGEFVARCGPSSCTSTLQYDAVVRSGTTTVTIPSVIRDHEGNWTCAIQFAGSSYVARDSCILQVLVPADPPVCSHMVYNTYIEVTCFTAQVYPEATCEWLYQINSQSKVKLSNSQTKTDHESFIVYGHTYIRTECSATLRLSSFPSGAYTFTVTMTPSFSPVPKSLSVSKDHVVTLAPPPDPPVFTDTTGTNVTELTLREDQSVSFTCTIHGGTPAVYKTHLTCDNAVWGPTVSELGPKVELAIMANRRADGKTCQCRGEHITGYSLTSVIRFTVIYPSSVSSFGLFNWYGPISSEDVQENRDVSIQCKVSGTAESRIELYHSNYMGNLKLLQNVTGLNLVYNLRTACNSSGRYVCITTSMYNFESHQMSLALKVKCSPEHCNGNNGDQKPTFGVAVNKVIDVRLCFIANPEPFKFLLYRGINYFETSRYNVTINYTQNIWSVGEVKVTINGLKSNETGEFILYELNSQNKLGPNPLKFLLKPQGPPQCPSDLQLVVNSSAINTLSWKPGFNGGLTQTFILLAHRLSGTNDDNPVEVGREVEASEPVMYHNVTGLSPGVYHVTISAVNSMGATECPRESVNITIADEAASDGQVMTANVSAYVIPVVVIIILVFIAIIVVIVLRRRRKKSSTPVANKDPIRPLEIQVKAVETPSPKVTYENSNVFLEMGKDKEAEENSKSEVQAKPNDETHNPYVTYENTIRTIERNRIKEIARRPHKSLKKSAQSVTFKIDTNPDNSIGQTYAVVIKPQKVPEIQQNEEIAENIYNNVLERVVNESLNDTAEDEISPDLDLPDPTLTEDNTECIYENTKQLELKHPNKAPQENDTHEDIKHDSNLTPNKEDIDQDLGHTHYQEDTKQDPGYTPNQEDVKQDTSYTPNQEDMKQEPGTSPNQPDPEQRSRLTPNQPDPKQSPRLSPKQPDPKQSPRLTPKQPDPKQSPGRTRSPQGLVYIDVEINRDTKKPAVKPAPANEEVEYFSIDLLATSQSNCTSGEEDDL